MHADFYNFVKRVNSTKRPTGAGLWSPEINLKLNTSMRNPVLQMGSQQSAEEINSYNYLKLGDIGYYFIDDWTSIRGDFWEASASLDLLATYADAIRATSAFVEYDTTPNPGIIDHRLSNLTDVSYAGAEATLSVFSYVPSFVVGVTGKGGCVSYFSMSLSYLNRLLNDVEEWSELRIEDTGDSIKDLLLAFLSWARKSLASGSAPQNIRSCVWLPWTVEGTTKTIYLGTYNVGFGGKEVTEPVSRGRIDLQIPWQASDWRASPNNHSFELYLPYVGVVGIDAGLIAGNPSMTVFYALDNRDGSVAYRVTSEGCVIGTYSGCAGVSIPIGVASSTLPQVIGAVSQVGSIISGNMGAAAGLAQSAINLTNPSVTCIGSLNGGAASGVAGMTLVLTSIYHPTNVAPSSVSAVMGTPTMQTKSLAGLTGFVKTRGASVAADCGADELSAINAMLDGGIYLE